MQLESQYLLYARDCASWGVDPLPYEEYAAYWEVFAKDSERFSPAAPILVQERKLPVAKSQPPAKPPFAGHYQQATGHRI